MELNLNTVESNIMDMKFIYLLSYQNFIVLIFCHFFIFLFLSIFLSDAEAFHHFYQVFIT